MHRHVGISLCSSIVRQALLILSSAALVVLGPATMPQRSFADSSTSTIVYLPLLVSGPTSAPPPRNIYAYYYLWWSYQNWYNKLAPNFPYQLNPLPLPATLDSQGCNPVSLYVGNQLIDVPQTLWTQDDPGLLEQDVRLAASKGLAGFIVNWAGTGELNQTNTSNSFNRRLAALVDAVHQVSGEGISFKLWISYKASATILSLDYIQNDLAYLQKVYALDPALDRRYAQRPLVVWQGSRKYPLDTIRAISQSYRSTFFLVGDENWTTWGDGRAVYLDGDTYYWSSQNPYTNPASFAQLQNLAGMVRAAGANPDGSAKLWFAPLTAGYNSQLSTGSTCVPRNNGDTLRRLYDGNMQSNPDGWAFISWNEITEGTYVVPLQRWGMSYLDKLRDLTQ